MQDETEHLKDYLRGVKRGGSNALAQLTAFSDWPGMCQRELERRATFLLKALPDEILHGLAGGEIDMRQAIGDVLAE